jgi:hypothetical protein
VHIETKKKFNLKLYFLSHFHVESNAFYNLFVLKNHDYNMNNEMAMYHYGCAYENLDLQVLENFLNIENIDVVYPIQKDNYFFEIEIELNAYFIMCHSMIIKI